MKRKNKKIIVLFLIVAVAIISFVFVYAFNAYKKASVATGKLPYICDSAVANCAHVTTTPGSASIPKGVCIPGGKCT